MFLQKIVQLSENNENPDTIQPFCGSFPPSWKWIHCFKKKKCHVLCPINFRKPCFKSKQQRFIINFKKYLTSKGILSERTDPEDMTVEIWNSPSSYCCFFAIHFLYNITTCVCSVTTLSVLLLLFSSYNLLDNKSKLSQCVPVLLESDIQIQSPKSLTGKSHTFWHLPKCSSPTIHTKVKKQKNPSPRKRRHNPCKEKEDRVTQRQEGNEKTSKVRTNPHLACWFQALAEVQTFVTYLCVLKKCPHC